MATQCGSPTLLARCGALHLPAIIVCKRSQQPAAQRTTRLIHDVARSVAVKSRGHFRGGFDEFFKPEQIVEVDLPGLTSPMLNRFEWTHLPRPVVPLDRDVSWHPSCASFG